MRPVPTLRMLEGVIGRAAYLAGWTKPLRRARCYRRSSVGAWETNDQKWDSAARTVAATLAEASGIGRVGGGLRAVVRAGAGRGQKQGGAATVTKARGGLARHALGCRAAALMRCRDRQARRARRQPP